MTTIPSDLDRNVVRSSWIELVRELCDEITTWAKAQGWPVAAVQRELYEEGSLGRYHVTALRIATNDGILLVTPVGRDIIGAEGRVDLEAFPTLERYVLLRRGDAWLLRDDYATVYPKPWGEEAFVEVAKQLTRPT